MKYLIGTLSALIGLGLILRFGGSANALASTLGYNVNQLTSGLELSTFQGNNPPGVG